MTPELPPDPVPSRAPVPAAPRAWTALARPRATVVALGNFDGVHRGHRRLLEAVRTRAAALDADPVALTFEPHPRQFLFPEARTSLLTSPREKAALTAAEGVELVTIAFDAGFAALTAEAFVDDVLRGRLRGAHFFLGGTHRFGRGARGDAGLLRDRAGAERVTEVAPVADGGETISSSAIRHHLKNGELERAHRMLGRRYRLRGSVIPGAARGRSLGFPTANLRVEDARKILPFGVYGGAARLDDGAVVRAVANIGLKPTFSGPEPSVEVHLLDWSGDLYGREIEFEMIRRLRPERRFESIEALRDQIARDVAAWRDESPFSPEPVPPPAS